MGAGGGGVNSDGSVVVGVRSSANGGEAFRWTQADGMVGLGDLLGGGSSLAVAMGVNSDGSVVVGFSRSANGSEAFRWTQAGGMVGLGDLPGGGFESYARGINSDGLVVVGFGRSANGWEAFRWTQAGGMVGLGDLPGGYFGSSADAVNSDGSVVVGGSSTSANGWEAFRWTQAGGMVGLGDLSGGGFWSYAYGVNSDGSVVVGTASFSFTSGREAFRWTQAGGMVGLGVLPGYVQSWATGVNSDGSVVVGGSGGNSHEDGLEAFRWTQAGGMQRVTDWLAAAGVAVAPGYQLSTASDVSDDGSVVVGDASGPNGFEAYIARVSATGSGAVTLADVQESLYSAATGGGMALSAAGTVLNGTHSRPLAHRVEAGKKAFWLAGDWGRDDHATRDGDLGLAEVGGGMYLGQVQINVSLGKTWAEQELTLNGLAKADGAYLLTEALIPVAGNLWATLGGYGHWGKADLRRGYLNAGSQDYSIAKPGVDTWGLRARLDWENVATLASADITPYADLTHSETKLDAYTETEGGFPAQFNDRKDKATELRLGVNTSQPLLDDMRLIGIMEAVHRFESSGDNTTGQVVGLFGFDLPGPEYKQDWLRAGLGVEDRLMDGTASLMINATTKGESPNVWLAASWQKTF